LAGASADLARSISSSRSYPWNVRPLRECDLASAPLLAAARIDLDNDAVELELGDAGYQWGSPPKGDTRPRVDGHLAAAEAALLAARLGPDDRGGRRARASATGRF